MRLSQFFANTNRLEIAHKIEDGFRDAGAGADPAVAGSCVVVDRGRDSSLERFAARCRKKLRKAKDEVAQAMVLALLVSDTCGRSGAHALDLVRQHLRLASEHRNSDTGELLVGNLLGDRVTGNKRRGKHPPTGAGLVAHRAFLYKALTDWLDLPECTLERRPLQAGEKATNILYTMSWNVVLIGSLPCVVDLLYDPGALYEENSPKATEYRRLLAATEAEAMSIIALGGANGGNTQLHPVQPPSCREDLAGIVPRPPWHVEPWALDLRREDRIGRGGFGEVFRGGWAGIHVAIKEIKGTTPTDAEVVDFMLEIALLSQLNHPNIVRFWRGCAEIRGGCRSLLMVIEYIRTGGLSRLLHGHGGPPLAEPLTLAQALALGLDISRGVRYLHRNRILHLDLKSPNVLVSPPWTAKLCDFGLAKIRGEHTMVQSTLQGVSPVWAPPEMFDDVENGLTEKADVYSFAVIFFELLTKRVPFQEVSSSQLPSLKASGQLPQIPEGVPSDCGEFILHCCAAKPGARPSMSGVVARVRELTQSHGLNLLDVRPPPGLFGVEDGQEAQVQKIEEDAARRLVELDGERAKLRTELNELQLKLEQVRKRGSELATAAGGNSAAVRPSQSWDDAANRECDDSWCDAFVQEVAGSKFRCSICSKLFRGAEFVRRHVAAKHGDEVRRAAEDAYFDCDVSREDSIPAHSAIPTARFSPSPRRAGSGVGPGFSQAFQDAAERGDNAQVTLLLELRADAHQRDDNGTGPLTLAARAGHLTIVRTLVAAAAGGSPNRAAEKEKEAIERMTTQSSGSGLTPLHVSAAEGHCSVLAELIASRADVEPLCSQGKTPLLHAAENGHASVCKLLIDAGASATVATPGSETLLHLSARFGDPHLIEQVVAWKADLSSQDRDGWTPLHEAAHWGLSGVEAMLRCKADVKAKSRDGETALHVALEGFERAATCEVLLRWGADPSDADADGEQPLHVAARKSALDACRLLVLGSADPNAVDGAGRRPLELAQSEEVKHFFREVGAQPDNDPGIAEVAAL